MAVQSRERKPRAGEKATVKHYTHRVLWRRNGARDGKWQSVTVGHTDGHGKQARALDAWLRDVHGYRLNADDARIAEFLGLAKPEPEPAEDDEPAPSVRELVEAWASVPKRTRNPSTARTYRSTVKLLGSLGDMPATAVTAAHVNAWFAGLDKGIGLKGGKPAAVSSQRQRLMVLRGALGGHVAADAFDGVAYGDNRRVTRDKALTEDQVRALMANAGDSGMALPIRVGAELGLRPGELCGLTAGDVDLDGLVVHVERQVRGDNRKRDGFTTEPPKHGSARSIRINPELADALALVRELPADAPVFTHGDGDYWNYDQWSAAWGRLVAKTPGVPDAATPHALRHTAAIVWLTNGASPGQVKNWLGHASIKVTDEHYGQFSADAERAIMRAAGLRLA